MSEGLHYRLRDRSQRLWVTEQDLLDNNLFRQAADLIEELEKELNISRMANVIMDNTVEELEAKLDKAVEALRFLIEATTVPEANTCITRALADARAVLAELEK